ncbi:hypothetical protein P7K49_031504, partial [Saguinus oedipus]
KKTKELGGGEQHKMGSRLGRRDQYRDKQLRAERTDPRGTAWRLGTQLEASTMACTR